MVSEVLILFSRRRLIPIPQLSIPPSLPQRPRKSKIKEHQKAHKRREAKDVFGVHLVSANVSKEAERHRKNHDVGSACRRTKHGDYLSTT